MLKRKILIFLSVMCIALGSLYLFIHSTPERVIRADLFFKQHNFTNAFKTHIRQNPSVDIQYGTRYYCEDPSIGPDYYDIDSKTIGILKFWYINWSGTGGG